MDPANNVSPRRAQNSNNEAPKEAHQATENATTITTAPAATASPATEKRRKEKDKEKQQSLLYAAATGDATAVKKLLDEGHDVNRRGPQNATPLHLASFYDREECVALLIDHGASIDAVDNDSSTPLQNAAFNGSLAAMKVLIAKNASIMCRDNDGSTPLHKASFAGKKSCIRFLLRKGAAVNATDDSGCTPLHHAINNGHVECVEYLLRKGADANAKAEDKTTPLHRAVYVGNVDCVQQLLSLGASATDTDTSLATPLHYAAEAGSADAARILLTHNANVNALDAFGSSPLGVASFKGHIKLIRLLMENGAKQVVDRAIATPLHHAASGGHVEAIAVLQELGGDVNARDTEGWTPILRASAGGHREAVRILISRGATVACVDNHGQTPVHLAVISGNAQCVSELVQVAGGAVDAKDAQGETALHKAARYGFPECAQVLLDAGANINASSLAGTPLHMACAEGHHKVVDLLLTTGADMHMTAESDGAEPIHYAAGGPNSDVLQFLLEFLFHEFFPPMSNPLRVRSISAHAPASASNLSPTRPTPSASTRSLSSRAGAPARTSSTFIASPPPASNKLKSRLSNAHSHSTPDLGVLTAQLPPSPSSSPSPSTQTPSTPVLPTSSSIPPRRVNRLSVSVPPPVLSTRSNSASPLPTGLTTRPPPTRNNSTVFSLPDKIFRVQDKQGRYPIQYAIKDCREDNLQLLLMAGHFVPGSIWESEDVPASWKDLIKVIMEKRENVNTDDSPDKIYAIAVQDFNKKPKKGLEYLFSKGILNNTPKDIGYFLYATVGLSKRKLGDFLGEGEDYNVKILEAYISQFDFTGMRLDEALRHFLSKFWLPGEAQKIDRFMDFFARQFCKNNPSVFPMVDTAYVLAFSLIMLNTDQHNPAIKKENKMTLEQFIRNTSAIPGIDQVEKSTLESLYAAIVRDEIHIDTEGSVFSNIEKKGWLTKQGGRIKTWKQRWFLLSANVLYYFKSPTDPEPLGMIPLENVEVRACETRGRKFTFGLYARNSKNNETLKAAKYQGSGLVPAHHESYILAAEAKEFMDSWIAAISKSIFQSPFQDLVNKRKSALNQSD